MCVCGGAGGVIAILDVCAQRNLTLTHKLQLIYLSRACRQQVGFFGFLQCRDSVSPLTGKL